MSVILLHEYYFTFLSCLQIVGVDCVYFIQKNELDRRNRTLKIKAFNESFSSRVIINENCNYSVSCVQTPFSLYCCLYTCV